MRRKLWTRYLLYLFCSSHFGSAAKTSKSDKEGRSTIPFCVRSQWRLTLFYSRHSPKNSLLAAQPKTGTIKAKKTKWRSKYFSQKARQSCGGSGGSILRECPKSVTHRRMRVREWVRVRSVGGCGAVGEWVGRRTTNHAMRVTQLMEALRGSWNFGLSRTKATQRFVFVCRTADICRPAKDFGVSEFQSNFWFYSILLASEKLWNCDLRELP